jgi:HEAT repeat protein
VTFIGCRLNGAKFTGASLTDTRIIGCFAADTLPPVDLRNVVCDQVTIVNSHLHMLQSGPAVQEWVWLPPIADAAAGTLLDRSDKRCAAASRLAALGDQRVALITACLLADREWEVRSTALDALRQLYRGSFQDASQELLDWAFQCLGDAHSIVRLAAGRLVRLVRPPQDILQRSALRVRAAQPQIRLSGLRAAVELARSDPAPGPLIDCSDIDALLADVDPAIRAEAFHLLGILDEPAEGVWSKGLRDPAADVRIRALEAIRLLSVGPPASLVTPLLHDVNPEVRLEALYTLGQLGDYEPQDIGVALKDPNPEIHKAARRLLDSHRRD